jgi:hypothetical protein
MGRWFIAVLVAAVGVLWPAVVGAAEVLTSWRGQALVFGIFGIYALISFQRLHRFLRDGGL